MCLFKTFYLPLFTNKGYKAYIISTIVDSRGEDD